MGLPAFKKLQYLLISHRQLLQVHNTGFTLSWSCNLANYGRSLYSCHVDLSLGLYTFSLAPNMVIFVTSTYIDKENEN